MVEHGIPTDVSAIIYLAKAGALQPASACFGPLLMPSAVMAEVLHGGARRAAGDVAEVERAIAQDFIEQVPTSAAIRRRAQELSRRFGLGAGESEVLAIGSAYDVLLIDDRRAARAGRTLKLAIIETAFVPGACVAAGVLEHPAAFELLNAIGRHTTMRAEVLTQARRLIEEARP